MLIQSRKMYSLSHSQTLSISRNKGKLYQDYQIILLSVLI